MGPLSGVKVLDLTRLLPGPLCSHLLVRLGASVVKVEQPGGSDYVRYLPPHVSFSDDTSHGVLFEMLNAEKRSLLLNLKHEDGPKLLKRMISSYDILLEGNRPGVMKKLGVSYEELSKIHPGLIYCSLSGYGATGPYATRAGHDINYMAIAGALGLSGKVGQLPYLPGFQAADATGALSGAIGILSALYSRDSSRDMTLRGKGQFVDISLTESAMVLGLPTLSQALAKESSVTPRGEGALDGGLVNYNIYETQDGRYLAVGALELHFWESFCNAMDRPDLAKGSAEQVAAFFKTKKYDEWMDRLSKLSGCCVEPILSPEEILTHPLHLQRRAVLVEDNDAANVSSPQVVLGPRLSSHSPRLLQRASRAGEHSCEILREAGITENDIAGYLETKVIEQL